MNNNTEKGRSMIEMLGVLAIITVLSVCGLAGYSKAMQMYKANILRDGIIEILHFAISVKENLHILQTGEVTNLTSALVASGNIPAGMSYNNEYLTTKDGLSAQLVYGLKKWNREDGSVAQEYILNLRLYFKQNSVLLSLSTINFCENVITAAQPFGKEIASITFWISDVKNSALYTGKSLENTTPAEIKSKCRSLQTKEGTALLAISLNPF